MSGQVDWEARANYSTYLTHVDPVFEAATEPSKHQLDWQNQIQTYPHNSDPRVKSIMNIGIVAAFDTKLCNAIN
ncbi:unnamed protein product [Schistosoma curassoni]|uniref:SCP domain-containing protein n=1 Tax=Schistosoma curassoni TaxID=6186 RepID=A0A183KTW6_9TREM|nr:unnamed protein product [Schistosoma curassoni]